MLNAEKWYEYQSDYSKYGFDMKPKVTRTREQRKKSVVTAKDRSRLLWFIAVLGILGIFAVILSAYAATINYNNDKLRDDNSALRGEVETLQIQVESEGNIAEIQDKASSELGMVYPEGQKLVTLSSDTKTPEDLASTLKNNAFN